MECIDRPPITNLSSSAVVVLQAAAGRTAAAAEQVVDACHGIQADQPAAGGRLADRLAAGGTRVAVGDTPAADCH